MGTHNFLICHDCKFAYDIGKIYHPETTNFEGTFSTDELVPITKFLAEHRHHRIESITEHDQDFIGWGVWQYNGTVFDADPESISLKGDAKAPEV